MLEAITTGAPSFWGATLAQAKAFCRVEDTADFDAQLTVMLKAATLHAEKTTRSIISLRTMVQAYACFDGSHRLRQSPVISLDSVDYYDASDADTALAGVYTGYTDELGFLIVQNDDTTLPSTFDRPDAVRFTFKAGFATEGDVPEDLQSAILLHVGTMFKFREDLQPEKVSPSGIYDMLIEPHRRWEC